MFKKYIKVKIAFFNRAYYFAGRICNNVASIKLCSLYFWTANITCYSKSPAYFLQTSPDIQKPLQPLENATTNFLLPALFDHKCCPLERDILALPVRKGRIGLANLCIEAPLEYLVSKKVTAPLADQIRYMNFLIIRKHKNGTERENRFIIK
jgi:hypothetical protein